jgi:CRP-like cAMP-binding protein
METNTLISEVESNICEISRDYIGRRLESKLVETLVDSINADILNSLKVFSRKNKVRAIKSLILKNRRLQIINIIKNNI